MSRLRSLKRRASDSVAGQFSTLNPPCIHTFIHQVIHNGHAFDLEQKLEYAEDRYEVVHHGTMVAEELITRSPSCRWYSQEEANAVYRGAGFAQIRAFSGFALKPACPEDTIFTVVGTRP